MLLFQVQSNHFEEFFAPELDKHGYQALFKRKTAEVCSAKRMFVFASFWIFKPTNSHLMQVFTGSINNIDGCATFFRRDRFSHVKKYEVRSIVWRRSLLFK